ncbi:MAG TPA: hypothetical protein VGO62_12995 [Myxococcota bacterium]|jgi:hypothetical protein
MRPDRRLACLVVALATSGACTADFLPASLIVNDRVIAVTAEPPEATPGASVTLTPTVVGVAGTLASTSFTSDWWRCPDSDSDALGDYDQCTVPADRRDIASGTPYVDSVPADIFGALPPPRTPPPADGSSTLSSDKALGAILGYWRVVGFTMSAGERHVDAFKREPIYLPGHLGDVDPRFAAVDSHVDDNGNDIAPNSNPTISNVLLHEGKVDGATKSTLSSSKTYFFDPVYDARTLQSYISLKVDLTGLDLTSTSGPASVASQSIDDLVKRFSKVQRCEIPTFSWFATAGRFDRDSTVDESVVASIFDPEGVDCPAIEGEPRVPQVSYAPPTGAAGDEKPKDGVVHAWVVMRDGRGGTAVKSFDFKVE